MKYFSNLILLILLLISTGYGQTFPKHEVSSFNTPTEWISALTSDSSFFPLFERKQIATWTFKNKSANSLGVTFYIFNYTSEDSAFFHDKTVKYMTLSSCLLVSSDKPDENFISFQRGNYFFLMKMYPCNTNVNLQCHQLAKQLFEWIM